ncbi:MAG TPA: PrgI family protein [Candidatus Saccharimonadales bacterium]|nr:PrgI family protein [Candidatus Saccharimonadales bacterium]
MATYKVIQDIEAEDKILGPLTLRQFIYAGASAVCLYLTYFVMTHHAGFLAVAFLPTAAIGAFFAFPWGRDQPTEIWALAKIRFLLKPRRRIWDQSGVKELVTVTAPKKEVVDYTNGLSETEVRSRLRALADTIDSRGWVVKDANVNMYTQPGLVMNEPTSDRLLGPISLPQQVDPADIRADDDMLDEKNNPAAKQLDSMINASAQAHRQKIVDSLSKPAQAPPMMAPPTGAGVPSASSAKRSKSPATPPNNYWFLNQPAQATTIPSSQVTFNTQVVTPGMSENDMPMSTAEVVARDEAELVHELDARKQQLPTTAYYGHLHTVQPLSPAHQVALPQQQANSQQLAADQQQLAAPSPVIPKAPPVVQPQPQPIAPAPAMGGLPLMPMTPVQPWQPPAEPAQPQVTPAQQAAILQLANNNDLNVATIAREAERTAEPDEVVIKLH